jgi:hypothetical protein
VADGETDLVPEGATAPIPWSMEIEPVPDTLQLNVLESPSEISSGVTVK